MSAPDWRSFLTAVWSSWTTAAEIRRSLRRASKNTERPAGSQEEAGEKIERHEHQVVVQINLPEAMVKEYYASQTRQRRRYVITTLISGAGLVLVFGYTYVSYNQWQTAKQALNITERAWLIGTVAKIDVDKVGIMTVTASFMNSGKGPAFHVRHRIENTWTPVAPVIQLPLGGSGSEVSLPQGGTITAVTRFVSIPPQEVREILTGQKPFFFWLAIKYSDPFSGDPNVNDRETLECWTYNEQHKSLVICPSGQFHR